MDTAPEVIRSRTHALLKRAAAALAGREPGLVVLEGDRLVDDALRHGWTFEVVLVAEDRVERAAELGEQAPVRRVEPGLLSRISELKTSPGVLALASAPEGWAVESLDPAPDALVLVVAGVSDPGNLGALARAAEAAGAAAIVFVRGGASPWHPRALRGSMGSLLRLPLVRADDAAACASALEQQGLRNVVAATRGGRPLRDFDWSGPVALWVTGETGRAPAICDGFDGVSIPMAGGVESLNVTVAGALLLFAAGRNDAEGGQ